VTPQPSTLSNSQARAAQGVDHGLAQRSGAWISSQGQLAAQQQASSSAGLFANRSAGMLFSRSFAAEAKAAAASTTARPAARAGTKAAAGSQAANAAGAAGSGSQLSPFEQWRRNFQRVPSVPKWLGLTGAIPFIALAPPVCKHLAPLLPTTISENCAMIQVRGGQRLKETAVDIAVPTLQHPPRAHPPHPIIASSRQPATTACRNGQASQSFSRCLSTGHLGEFFCPAAADCSGLAAAAVEHC